MKTGDLVCYNAAGQRNKTLGMIMDIVWELGTRKALIHWCVVSDIMPRSDYTKSGKEFAYGAKIFGGAFVWHELGDWFEVVSSV